MYLSSILGQLSPCAGAEAENGYDDSLPVKHFENI
jgi:hypothetical protein